MWERFSDTAKEVVNEAREIAAARGDDYVRTLHVLLALLNSRNSVAMAILAELGVKIETVVALLEKDCAGKNAKTKPEDMTFTPRAKQVLETAVELQRKHGGPCIGTEHLFLALATLPDVLPNDLVRTLQLGPDFPAKFSARIPHPEIAEPFSWEHVHPKSSNSPPAGNSWLTLRDELWYK